MNIHIYIYIWIDHWYLDVCIFHYIPTSDVDIQVPTNSDIYQILNTDSSNPGCNPPDNRNKPYIYRYIYITHSLQRAAIFSVYVLGDYFPLKGRCVLRGDWMEYRPNPITNAAHMSPKWFSTGFSISRWNGLQLILHVYSLPIVFNKIHIYPYSALL